MLTALFMLRNPSFIDDVPEEHKKDFVDGDKLAPYKLKILKKMIHDRFPVCIILSYHTSAVASSGFRARRGTKLKENKK